MAKSRRAWRYEVTDVTGSMVGNLKVGETIIDYWHGKSHTYTIFNRSLMEETGSFSVRLLGEHDVSWETVKAQGELVPQEAADGD